MRVNKIQHLMFVSLMLFVFLSSCKQYKTVTVEKAFVKVLETNIKNDSNTVYKLDTLLDFKWDKLLIRTAYLPKNTFTKCAVLNSLPSSKLDGAEGADEYVFIKDNKICKYAVYDNENSQIIINFEKALLERECGIDNTMNLYIKPIANLEKTFSGRTFLIYEVK